MTRQPATWPMPDPKVQDNATLITEAARLLRYSKTDYTVSVADELERRFGK